METFRTLRCSSLLKNRDCTHERFGVYASGHHANRSSRLSPEANRVEWRPHVACGAGLGEGRERIDSDPWALAQSGHHTRFREYQHRLLRPRDKKSLCGTMNDCADGFTIQLLIAGAPVTPACP